MSSRFLLALCLAYSSLSISAQGACGEFPDVGFDGPDMRSFQGRYENPNYYFGVTIPPGLTGHDAPPPMPHHGFGIVLSWTPRSYIWVDGTYNSTDLPDAKAALEQLVEFMNQDGAKIKSTKFYRIKHGFIFSTQVIIQYKCNAYPVDRVKHLSAIIKNGIIYKIGLDTTEKRYNEDYSVFNALVSSWHLIHHHT
jgi:hypothetical protein